MLFHSFTSPSRHNESRFISKYNFVKKKVVKILIDVLSKYYDFFSMICLYNFCHQQIISRNFLKKIWLIRISFVTTIRNLPSNKAKCLSSTLISNYCSRFSFNKRHILEIRVNRWEFICFFRHIHTFLWVGKYRQTHIRQ